MRRRVQGVRYALAQAFPELLAAIALLSGWALLTWGVASLLVWQVWPISAGLLLLALFGFGFLGTIAREGLYLLSKRGARRG